MDGRVCRILNYEDDRKKPQNDEPQQWSPEFASQRPRGRKSRRQDNLAFMLIPGLAYGAPGHLRISLFGMTPVPAFSDADLSMINSNVAKAGSEERPTTRPPSINVSCRKTELAGSVADWSAGRICLQSTCGQAKESSRRFPANSGMDRRQSRQKIGMEKW